MERISAREDAVQVGFQDCRWPLGARRAFYLTRWHLGHKCEREIPNLVREDRFQVGFQDRSGQNHLGVIACGVP